MFAFTILIISEGQDELLKNCLQSLRLTKSHWQLIIVSNGRPLNEEVKTIAASLTTEHTFLESTETLTPGQARNLGLNSVQSPWIFFLSENAWPTSTYWDTALPILENPMVDAFGGPERPAKGMGWISDAWAISLSSPFCTGATFARHQCLGRKFVQTDEEKLSIVNLWIRTEIFNTVKFPEDYLKGEEIQLLQELKQKGLGIYYHPKLYVLHFRQGSISSLLRSTFREGFYRSRLVRKKLAFGSEVFWLPSIFVLLHFLFFAQPLTFWTLARLYSGIIIFVSLGLSFRDRKPWLFPLVAFIHYYVVFFYGLGFLSERGRSRR